MEATEKTTDLVHMLQDAASVALENERPGLTYDVGRLKTITVELSVANNGAIVAGSVYIERNGKTLRRIQAVR